jgi:hypothetical protein
MGTIKILSNKIILKSESGEKETWSVPRTPTFEVGVKYIRFRGQFYF